MQRTKRSWGQWKTWALRAFLMGIGQWAQMGALRVFFYLPAHLATLESLSIYQGGFYGLAWTDIQSSWWTLVPPSQEKSEGPFWLELSNVLILCVLPFLGIWLLLPSNKSLKQPLTFYGVYLQPFFKFSIQPFFVEKHRFTIKLAFCKIVSCQNDMDNNSGGVSFFME